MRIQHNITAMNAYRNYTNNTSAVAKNLEKLSSGYKINRAGDDAAGLAISEKMRAQITGLKTAQKNAKDGISLVKTAEGALTEVHDMLNRMYELAEQSANGVYDDPVDRANLQKEVSSLSTEIDRIADSVNFNGINLLDGSLSSTGTSASLAEVDLSQLSGNMAGAVKTVDAVKGKYEMNAALAADQVTAEGDKLTIGFQITGADGKTENIEINLTLAKDSNGDLKKLIADDGSEYDLAAAAKQTQDELTDALTTELNKISSVKDNFNVSVDNTGKIMFEAKTAGTDAPSVTGVTHSTTVKATGVTTAVNNSMKVDTKAEDAFETIDLTKATIFDGSKDLDKAVFEINGEKFVFINKDKVDADSLAKLKEAGVEHYVEVGTADTIGNADVQAMADKISMETGLKVETGAAATANGVTTWTKQAGTTIALKSNSTAGSKKGGLTLQIGDTADKFNQITVSISDMHVKAMGIGSIDIGKQGGASDAMAKIKDAINYVSSTRGDLGATQNRLDHTINNLSVMQENIQDAESSIRDVDVADEMMAYTKNNILVQSAQAMLAQANQLPQGVLQLLQ